GISHQLPLGIRQEKLVRKIYKCKNVSRYPETTYEISPEELLQVITEIEESGLELLGFYHSHPIPLEHPSYIDAGRAAWSGHSYVIISIAKLVRKTHALADAIPLGRRKIGSWIWDEEKKQFIEEEVIIR
ncbi:MAG: M67 family metallopeptidase, partial [Candidatus Hydrothermarchaeota archaeon]|nr:M67 family metallopeptidase [Candidatus Hydrothermarchaeota archaeon]